VYLLAGDMLATVAVGLGIIWEHGPPDVRVVANRLVVGGVIAETLCSSLLFAWDANTIGEQNDKIIALQARSWTKAQFDGIQEIKGKVTDVGVLPEKSCLECGIFAMYIETALNAAGVKLHIDSSLEMPPGSGIWIILPEGSNLESPLMPAFKKAGLGPLGPKFHIRSQWSPVRTDIPVIFVGEKYPEAATFPYFPTGQSAWTELPLKNPEYVPPSKK
jgi:hypothetical protein